MTIKPFLLTLSQIQLIILEILMKCLNPRVFLRIFGPKRRLKYNLGTRISRSDFFEGKNAKKHNERVN